MDVHSIHFVQPHAIKNWLGVRRIYDVSGDVEIGASMFGSGGIHNQNWTEAALQGRICTLEKLKKRGHCSVEGDNGGDLNYTVAIGAQ